MQGKRATKICSLLFSDFHFLATHAFNKTSSFHHRFHADGGYVCMIFNGSSFFFPFLHWRVCISASSPLFRALVISLMWYRGKNGLAMVSGHKGCSRRLRPLSLGRVAGWGSQAFKSCSQSILACPLLL